MVGENLAKAAEALRKEEQEASKPERKLIRFTVDVRSPSAGSQAIPVRMDARRTFADLRKLLKRLAGDNVGDGEFVDTGNFQIYREARSTQESCRDTDALEKHIRPHSLVTLSPSEGQRHGAFQHLGVSSIQDSDAGSKARATFDFREGRLPSGCEIQTVQRRKTEKVLTGATQSVPPPSHFGGFGSPPAGTLVVAAAGQSSSGFATDPTEKHGREEKASGDCPEEKTAGKQKEEEEAEEEEDTGKDTVWEEQPDGSHCLHLQPGQYLKLPFEFPQPPHANNTKLNNYTVSMDVCFTELPDPSIPRGVALFGTSWPELDEETLVFLNSKGSVGCLGDFGRESRSPIKAGEWHRVTVVFGGPLFRMEIRTYVDGQPVAVTHRPEFGHQDSKAMLPREGMLLFGSLIPEQVPGVRVRWVEVRTTALTSAEVADNRFANQVFNIWKMQKEKEDALLSGKLSLSSLGGEDQPPVWSDGAFAGLFGDPFIENTTLEGGLVAPSTEVMALTLRRFRWRLLSSPPEQDFGAAVGLNTERLRMLQAVLDHCAWLSREWQNLQRSGSVGVGPFVSLLQVSVDELECLPCLQQLPAAGERANAAAAPGDLKAFLRTEKSLWKSMPRHFLLFPGGWLGPLGGHAIMYLIEKQPDGHFRFTVSNTGDGLQYHPSTAQFPPKIKYQTSFSISDIPRSGFSDTFFSTLVHLQTRGGESHQAKVVYETLLPMLADRPLDTCFAERNTPGCLHSPTARSLLPAAQGKQEEQNKRRGVGDASLPPTDKEQDSKPSTSSSPSSPPAACDCGERLPRGELVDGLEEAEWRTPQRAGTCYHRCVLEATRFLLRRLGFPPRETKLFSFHLRWETLRMALEDLQVVPEIDGSGQRMVEIAVKQFAATTVKLHKKGQLAPETLLRAESCVKEVERCLELVPLKDGDFVPGPPELDLDTDHSDGDAFRSDLFPLFDHFVTQGSTQGLKGVEVEGRPQIPVDFSRILQVGPVRSFQDVLIILRRTDRLCGLLEAQRSQIKRWSELKVALLQYVLLEVIPIPEPPADPPQQEQQDNRGKEEEEKSFTGGWWTDSVQYSQQLEFGLSVHHLAQYLLAALIPGTLDSGRAAILYGVLLTLLDASMRRLATDNPSTLSRVLLGVKEKRDEALREARKLEEKIAAVEARRAAAAQERQQEEKDEGTEAHLAESSDAAAENASGGNSEAEEKELTETADRGGVEESEEEEEDLTTLLELENQVVEPWRWNPFGIGLASFAQLTANRFLSCPKLVIARTKILRYHEGLQLQEENLMFRWEEGNRPDPGVVAFVDNVCELLALPPKGPPYIAAGMTHDQDGQAETLKIAMDYPEFEALRDVSWMFKVSLTGKGFGNGRGEIIQPQVRLIWNWQAMSGTFSVSAGGLLHNFTAVIPPGEEFVSAASLAALTSPTPAETEEDLLHTETLPDFSEPISGSEDGYGIGGSGAEEPKLAKLMGLGQRDSELLLSALTVPYLRIPLVLQFFGNPDRIHTLSNPRLQHVLEAVLFEPGAFLSAKLRSEVPDTVPTPDRGLLATSFGLLFNELICSPTVILDALRKILLLGVRLEEADRGGHKELVLFVFRITAQFLKFVRYLLDLHHIQRREEKTSVTSVEEELQISTQTAEVLESGFQDLTGMLLRDGRRILEQWIHTAASPDGGVDNDSKHFPLINACHAHLVLLHSPLRLEDLDQTGVTILLSSFFWLSGHYNRPFQQGRSRRNNDRTQPDSEPMEAWRLLDVFVVFQEFRETCLQRLQALNQGELNACLESIVRVSTGNGSRLLPAEVKEQLRLQEAVNFWSPMDKTEQPDAFQIREVLYRSQWSVEELNQRQLAQPAILSQKSGREEDRSQKDGSVMLDFNTGQITMQASNLESFPDRAQISSIMDALDVEDVGRLRCAKVSDAEHCTTYHIVGHHTRLELWKADTRAILPRNFRLYNPSRLPKTETWIVPILEPLRADYDSRFEVFRSLQIQLPKHALPRSALVARLEFNHPRRGTMFEALVFKEHRSLQLFRLESLGRRVYRRLVYCTDHRFAMADLPVVRAFSTIPHRRHERGIPTGPDTYRAAQVDFALLRDRSHPKNLSGFTERFVQTEHLKGLLPEIITTGYQFWQAEDDTIRGYPMSPDPNRWRRRLVFGGSGEELERDEIDREYLYILTLHRFENEGDDHHDQALFKALGGEEGVGAMVQRRRLTRREKVLLFGSDEGEEEKEKQQQQQQTTAENDGEKASAKLHRTEAEAEDESEDDGEILLPQLSTGDEAETTGETAEQLLCLLYQPEGSPLFSLSRLTARMDDLSGVLALRTNPDGSGKLLLAPDFRNPAPRLEKLHFPRLKLTFFTRETVHGADGRGGRETRLYSLDHAELCVSNRRSPLTDRLLNGLPFSWLMENGQGDLSVLMPAAKFHRPELPSAPFSTALSVGPPGEGGPAWKRNFQTPYLLYPIHVSSSFLFTRSLSSALYLLLLRFAHRQYEEVFRLANSCASDRAEHSQLWKELQAFNSDKHPDAHACRLKLSLAVLDSSLRLPWNIGAELTAYLRKLDHVSSVCRLSPVEERQLIRIVLDRALQESPLELREVTLMHPEMRCFLLNSMYRPLIGDLVDSTGVWRLKVLSAEADGRSGVVALYDQGMRLALKTDSNALAMGRHDAARFHPDRDKNPWQDFATQGGKGPESLGRKLPLQFQWRLEVIDPPPAEEADDPSSPSSPHPPSHGQRKNKRPGIHVMLTNLALQESLAISKVMHSRSLSAYPRSGFGSHGSRGRKAPHFDPIVSSGLKTRSCVWLMSAPDTFMADLDLIRNRSAYLKSLDAGETAAEVWLPEWRALRPPAKDLTDPLTQVIAELRQSAVRGGRCGRRGVEQISQLRSEEHWELPSAAVPAILDQSFLRTTSDQVKSAQIQKPAPQANRGLRGVTALEFLEQWMETPDDSRGSLHGRGFLTLYGFFGGHAVISLGESQTDGFEFGKFLMHLLVDLRSGKESLPRSLLLTLARNPQIASGLPKYIPSSNEDTGAFGNRSPFMSWGPGQKGGGGGAKDTDTDAVEQVLQELLAYLKDLEARGELKWPTPYQVLPKFPPPAEFVSVQPVFSEHAALQRSQQEKQQQRKQQVTTMLSTAASMVGSPTEEGDGNALPPPLPLLTRQGSSSLTRQMSQVSSQLQFRPQHIVPELSDCNCGRRTVGRFCFPLSGSEEELTFQLEEAGHFAETPLGGLQLEGYLRHVTRAENGLPPVTGRLPFDVTAHPQAQSPVAVAMLDRMETDSAEYAQQVNTKVTPQLKGFDLHSIQTMLSPSGQQHQGRGSEEGQRILEENLERLGRLQTALQRLREEDLRFLQLAIPLIVEKANNLLPPPSSSSSPSSAAAGIGGSRGTRCDGMEGPTDDDEKGEHGSRIAFRLRRLCGQESWIGFDYVIGSLLSSQAEHDLCKLNPFLSARDVQEILELTAVTLLHANRIGQLNRCISRNSNLIRILHWKDRGHPARVQAVQQTAEGLAQLLSTRRHYVKLNTISREEEKNFELEFDPRFLVFEFTWNIVLRETQVNLVREFMGTVVEKEPRPLDDWRADPMIWGDDSIPPSSPSSLLPPSASDGGGDDDGDFGGSGKDEREKGRSLVRQMLMGAGKTTVVSPLLALMLGDGNRLVCQVVPRQLLESTREVLRSTFSSIIQKRIYTVEVDRSTPLDSPELVRKLHSAIRTRAVVVTTPASLKTLVLKFLEGLDTLADPRSQDRHTPTLAREVREIGRVLQLLKSGVLLLDEVDLILHPLKSELNFPIGPKISLDLAPLRWELPIHICDALFYTERDRRISVDFQESIHAQTVLETLADRLEEGFRQRGLLRKPHLVLLDPQFYHSRLKPVITDWVTIWLQSKHLPLLSGQETAEYLLSGPGSRPAILEKIPQLPETFRKLLNLSRDWLLSFLPHIMSKIDRVSYGLLTELDIQRARADRHSKDSAEEGLRSSDSALRETRAKLAVPFIGKDVPSESSEYAHPDILIGLSILAFRYEGLRRSDFFDVIRSLREDFTNEIGPPALRTSNLLYEKWVTLSGAVLQDATSGVEAGKKKKREKARQEKEKSLVSSLEEQETDKDRISSLRATPLYFGDLAVEDELAAPEESPSSAPAEEKPSVVNLRLLKLNNQRQMTQLYELLRRQPEVLHHYLSEFIFPRLMQHQTEKLSASGQSLGGDLLFQQRFAFSGTPSELLPLELGGCGYEKGSDGLIVHTMTDPGIVSAVQLPGDWSVQSILDRIATAEEATGDGGEGEKERFHALIDTGALITGMTNREVAEYLLEKGLRSMDGVVYLDSEGRQVCLVRSTGREISLAQCGIPPEKRFTFYDQVHTTGTDIPQDLQAVAVQTLGKDMTFRDYAQGAFRMRLIGRGQRIRLFVIPEVAQLVRREMRLTEFAQEITGASGRAEGRNSARTTVTDVSSASFASDGSTESEAGFLRDVSAWLVINSMRSERVQWNQLQMQNLSNVWRKSIFAGLLEHHQSLTEPLLRLHSKEEASTEEVGGTEREGKDAQHEATRKRDQRITSWLKAFRESIDFRVQDSIPESKPYDEVLQELLDRHRRFIESQSGMDVCEEIIAGVQSMVQGALGSTLKLTRQLSRAESNDSTSAAASPPRQRKTPRQTQGTTAAATEERKMQQQPMDETENSSSEDELGEFLGELVDVRYQQQMLNVEMVQSQTQEQEQEKEITAEQEVEIEKFVDSAYQRSGQEFSVWEFSRLAQLETALVRLPPSSPGRAETEAKDNSSSAAAAEAEELHRIVTEGIQNSVPFYPLRAFSVNPPSGQERLMLGFPESLAVSLNYYDPRWSGARRIKNTGMILEWIPSPPSAPSPSSSPSSPGPAPAAEHEGVDEDYLERALQLLDFGGRGRIPKKGFADLIQVATGHQKPPAQLKKLWEEIIAARNDESVMGGRDQEYLTREEAKNVLRGSGEGRGRGEDTQPERRYVLLSLREAETIRRILHARQGGPLFPENSTVLQLRMLTSSGLALYDSSLHKKKEMATGSAREEEGCQGGDEAAEQQQKQTGQARDKLLNRGQNLAMGGVTEQQERETKALLRFFDGEMHYDTEDLQLILRRLQSDPPEHRHAFFSSSLNCRRRIRRDFKLTPLNTLFTVDRESQLLHTRALLARIRSAITLGKGLKLRDAFMLFDQDRDGRLNPEELWGALEWLGLRIEDGSRGGQGQDTGAVPPAEEEKEGRPVSPPHSSSPASSSSSAVVSSVSDIRLKDIVDLILHADLDRDRNLSLPEFIAALQLQSSSRTGTADDTFDGQEQEDEAAPTALSQEEELKLLQEFSAELDAVEASPDQLAEFEANPPTPPEGGTRLRDLLAAQVALEAARQEAGRLQEARKKGREAIRQRATGLLHVLSGRGKGAANPSLDHLGVKIDFSRRALPEGAGLRLSGEVVEDRDVLSSSLAASGGTSPSTGAGTGSDTEEKKEMRQDQEEAATKKAKDAEQMSFAAREFRRTDFSFSPRGEGIRVPVPTDLISEGVEQGYSLTLLFRLSKLPASGETLSFLKLDDSRTGPSVFTLNSEGGLEAQAAARQQRWDTPGVQGLVVNPGQWHVVTFAIGVGGQVAQVSLDGQLWMKSIRHFTGAQAPAFQLGKVLQIFRESPPRMVFLKRVELTGKHLHSAEKLVLYRELRIGRGVRRCLGCSFPDSPADSEHCSQCREEFDSYFAWTCRGCHQLQSPTTRVCRCGQSKPESPTWDCPACSGTNVASETNCFKCGPPSRFRGY